LNNSTYDIVGIIPAAGRGTRIAPLPLSKELFPIGFQNSNNDARPKVVSHYLLEQMINAGIERCFIILGNGKWDIPAYFGNGERFGINLAYSVIHDSPGTPYTLDSVYPFLSDSLVALGFPDIMFSDNDVYCQLRSAFQSRHCDVLLGLFPADQPHLSDMVALDPVGKVDRIVIKPEQTTLTHTWGIALWTPVFSKFMHEWLSNIDFSKPERLDARHGHGELFVGDVIQAAIEAGLNVEAVTVSEQPYLDIGTPQNLIRAIQTYTPLPKQK
jgi:glucose-1-phosphate thymidylyltransferase